MSILTDFIVAKANQENAILESTDTSNIGTTLQLSGVDTVKIQTLYNSIIDKPPYDTVDYNLTIFEGCAEEGPWLFKIPVILLNVLSNFENLKLKTIAEKWNNTEEIQLDGWSIEETTEVINDISSLAKKAIETKEELFLLISL